MNYGTTDAREEVRFTLFSSNFYVVGQTIDVKATKFIAYTSPKKCG